MLDTTTPGIGADAVRANLVCDTHLLDVRPRPGVTSMVALAIGEDAEALPAASRTRLLTSQSVEGAIARIAADAAPDGLLLCDANANTLYTNRAWLDLAMQTPEAAAGRGWLDVLEPHDARGVLTLLTRVGRGTVDWRLELPLRPGGAETRWVEFRGLAIRERDDLVAAWVVLAADVTRWKQALDHAGEAATYDRLTGVLSRTTLVDYLVRSLSRARRLGTTTAVLFIDLDDFGVVNEQVGRAQGDEALAAIARRLRSSLRSSDLVGRVGSDEFIGICEDLRDPGSAEAVASRVVHECAQPVIMSDGTLDLTASIGVVTSSAEEGAEDMINRANLAMYLARQHGNTFVVAPDGDGENGHPENPARLR